MLRLSDIMTRDVVTATPDMSIRDAMNLLSERHVSGAPVLDGPKIVGIVSAGDILELLADLNDTNPSLNFRRRKGRTPPLEDVTVDEVMTRKVHSLSPDETVDKAAMLMVEKQIHRVLVVKEDVLVGIVSTLDVARAVAEHRIINRPHVLA